ncbi:hypothetical protein BDP55DRAFT_8391 [Colletotrichum godetiae]|uniref:Uncharacterized protein n=1 Tax=Colletotrichum godetiae TaxID=1209918 RepID=A0AAJ0B085_9PEZI|nr:uncharacterized protein BDP55DRAFT_8391 [Colletotrichum godetiae]KAK1701053.1 hypothetical protein BDP55DRAFT_8391 [Colletotrichum godetiae]
MFSLWLWQKVSVGIRTIPIDVLSWNHVWDCISSAARRQGHSREERCCPLRPGSVSTSCAIRPFRPGKASHRLSVSLRAIDDTDIISRTVRCRSLRSIVMDAISLARFRNRRASTVGSGTESRALQRLTKKKPMEKAESQRHLHGSRGTKSSRRQVPRGKYVIVCNQTLALRGVGNMELLCIIDISEPVSERTIPTSMDGRQVTFCLDG